MTRTAGVVIILGGAMLTAACATVSVITDYDPQAVSSIGAYQSYVWLPQPPGRGDTRVNNELVAKRVINAVDEVLATRGYVKVQRDADFLIGWHAILEGKRDVTTINRSYGYGWGRRRAGGVVWSSDTVVREYDQGTLIIDVVDVASNELVWRGAAQGRVKAGASAEERSERIRNAVRKIFDKFPPQSGS